MHLKGVAKPRIYLHPPSPHTGNACAVRLNHRCYASTAPMLLPAIFSVILFVLGIDKIAGTLLFAFLFNYFFSFVKAKIKEAI